MGYGPYFPMQMSFTESPPPSAFGRQQGLRHAPYRIVERQRARHARDPLYQVKDNRTHSVRPSEAYPFEHAVAHHHNRASQYGSPGEQPNPPFWSARAQQAIAADDQRGRRIHRKAKKQVRALPMPAASRQVAHQQAGTIYHTVANKHNAAGINRYFTEVRKNNTSAASMLVITNVFVESLASILPLILFSYSNGFRWVQSFRRGYLRLSAVSALRCRKAAITQARLFIYCIILSFVGALLSVSGIVDFENDLWARPNLSAMMHRYEGPQGGHLSDAPGSSGHRRLSVGPAGGSQPMIGVGSNTYVIVYNGSSTTRRAASGAHQRFIFFIRYRGAAAVVHRMGAVLRGEAERHIRLRHLGRQKAAHLPRARPHGRQAAVHRAAEQHHFAVRLRNQIAAGPSGHSPRAGRRRAAGTVCPRPGAHRWSDAVCRHRRAAARRVHDLFAALGTYAHATGSSSAPSTPTACTRPRASAPSGPVDSTRRQLVADVPVCTFLSGGLDSTRCPPSPRRPWPKRAYPPHVFRRLRGQRQVFHAQRVQAQPGQRLYRHHAPAHRQRTRHHRWIRRSW